MLKVLSKGETLLSLYTTTKSKQTPLTKDKSLLNVFANEVTTYDFSKVPKKVKVKRHSSFNAESYEEEEQFIKSCLRKESTKTSKTVVFKDILVEVKQVSKVTYNRTVRVKKEEDVVESKCGCSVF